MRELPEPPVPFHGETVATKFKECVFCLIKKQTSTGLGWMPKLDSRPGNPGGVEVGATNPKPDVGLKPRQSWVWTYLPSSVTYLPRDFASGSQFSHL